MVKDYQNGMTPKELSEKYNRNSGTIIGKLKSLNVFIPTKTRYNNDDIEFLRIHYPLNDWDEIFKRFPKANKRAIYTVCHKYGITADYYGWSDDDIRFLKENYYVLSISDLYEIFDKRYSEDAIRTKAYKLGMSKDATWTDDEIAILKAYYSNSDKETVMKLLPNRTWQAIGRKCSQLHIKSLYQLNTYWNDEQTKLLFDNWKTHTDKELSSIIGKDIDSIQQKRWSNNLIRFHHYNNTTYESLQKYIRGNISSWKSEMMKRCNYKCVLTGSKNFEIHHLYSFNMIFNEFVEEYDIELKDLSEYTANELDFIVDKFKEKHDKVLGVCVRKDLHYLFHKLYGKCNTLEQWCEFEEKYKNGNFAQIT